VQALKFRAHLPLAAAFADLMMAATPHEAVASASVMLAVPLSAERIAQRGFNQAHEIAKPIARAWRLPLATELCVRVRNTEPQSSLPLAQRRGNMRDAFTLMRRDPLVGQHVVLVDDVMTTGETLEALSATLKRNGVARVTNLVFARTPVR
jgi:ComF family protein